MGTRSGPYARWLSRVPAPRCRSPTEFPVLGPCKARIFVQNGSPLPPSEVSVLTLERAVSGWRSLPRGTGANQLIPKRANSKIRWGYSTLVAPLNCWVCMKCSTRRELPGTGRINAHARSCIDSIRIAKPQADASASRRWAIASRSRDSKNSCHAALNYRKRRIGSNYCTQTPDPGGALY